MKLVSDADAVCWGSLAQRSEKSRAAILRLIDAVPDTSLKVFDINIRQHFLFDRLDCGILAKSKCAQIE